MTFPITVEEASDTLRVSDLVRTARDPELISMGIPQLDEFLGGGLDPGSLILLVEPAGAGGEIFAKQFSACDTSPAARSVFITTEESEREMERAFERFGFANVPQMVSIAQRHSQSLLIHQGPSHVVQRVATLQELLASDSTDLLKVRPRQEQDYLDELIRPYTSGAPPQRLTIHTLDFFLGLYGADRLIATLTAIKAANEGAGGLVLMVLTGGTAERAAHAGLLDRIADCVIELEFHRRGGQFEKFLHVKKVRNKFLGVGVAPYKIGSHGFELDNLNRIL